MSRLWDVGVFFSLMRAFGIFRVFLTKNGFFHINPCKQESIILKYIVKFGNTKHRKVEGNESD